MGGIGWELRSRDERNWAIRLSKTCIILEVELSEPEAIIRFVVLFSTSRHVYHQHLYVIALPLE